MEETDAEIFTDEEIAQGWHTDISNYSSRLQDQSLGKCISLTAVYQGMPAGYVNIYLSGLSGAFSGKGLPEIVDFGVLEKYRKKGNWQQTDGCCRRDRRAICRHGMAWRRTPQWVWKRSANVYQTRLYPGWDGCLVPE